MPEKEIHGDFVVRPDYDANAEVRRIIEKVRTELDKQLACIDAITDKTLQLICIFSLLDSMAQESAAYPAGDSRQAFCSFVLQHEHTYGYLDRVDPVTLFYRVEDHIDKAVLIPGFPAEKEVSLDSLGYIDMRSAREILSSPKADEILKYLEKKIGSGYADKKAEEHKLISLIYRMRSKATHEMTGLGVESTWHDLNMTEPYYRDVGRVYVEDEKVVSDDICELIIPNAFIRHILSDCIDGYLDECSAQCRMPFSNNVITRKYRLSWYDK